MHLTKSIFFLLISLLQISCNYQKNIDVLSEKSVKIKSQPDTLVIWFPENSVSIQSDTTLTIKGNTYQIETKLYTLNSNVQFVVDTDTNHYYINHYRNYGAEIIILKNDSLFFKKKFVKEDFADIFHPDILNVGIFEISFQGVENNRFFFDFSITKPETDWFVSLKYYINLDGQGKIEKYPESHFKME